MHGFRSTLYFVVLACISHPGCRRSHSIRTDPVRVWIRAAAAAAGGKRLWCSLVRKHLWRAAAAAARRIRPEAGDRRPVRRAARADQLPLRRPRVLRQHLRRALAGLRLPLRPAGGVSVRVWRAAEAGRRVWRAVAVPLRRGPRVLPPAAGSLFGAPAASSASLFGAPSSSPSLFGAQSGASPFGAPASGSSLFGGAAAGAFKPPSSGGGLFASGGSSLFGASAQSASSLFGAASTPPAAGSLFGGAASSPSLFGAVSQPAGGSLFGGLLFSQPAVAPAAAPVAAAVPGQSPYGVLPAVPKVPEMRTGIAASAPSRSVNVPPPVLFRPKPRLSTPLRSPKAASTPASTDTQRQLSKRSPSIFKVSYRDPGLVIQTPLPSTNSSVSPPSASDALPASPAFVSPPARASPSFVPAVTPQIQPAAGRHSSPLNMAPPTSGIPAMTPTLAANGSRDRTPPLASMSSPPPAGTSTSAQLPTLPEGWWVKPSMENLASMVERNPEALKAVDRFTVGQSGIGSIMYLEDVDLTGIDNLADVFMFEPGAASAYYVGCKLAKSRPGSGLNQPARVQIELTSKQMNRIMARRESHSTEEYLSNLKLRLKSLSAHIDATFVDLQVKGSKRAVWIFEVKHWSR